jgi:hypothetical protein
MIIITKTILITVLVVFLILHLGILFKWIPYSIVWCGRIKSDKEMYFFESVSIVGILIFILVSLVIVDFTNISLPENTKTTVLVLMSALFFLNTIVNIMSKNRIERLFFYTIYFFIDSLQFYFSNYLKYLLPDWNVR